MICTLTAFNLVIEARDLLTIGRTKDRPIGCMIEHGSIHVKSALLPGSHLATLRQGQCRPAGQLENTRLADHRTNCGAVRCETTNRLQLWSRSRGHVPSCPLQR